jgi:hypothetical protein
MLTGAVAYFTIISFGYIFLIPLGLKKLGREGVFLRKLFPSFRTFKEKSGAELFTLEHVETKGGWTCL